MTTHTIPVPDLDNDTLKYRFSKTDRPSGGVRRKPEYTIERSINGQRFHAIGTVTKERDGDWSRSASWTAYAGETTAREDTRARAVQILHRTDAGEFGATSCPHCGAQGRYVVTFRCEDGTTRGAMAGCIKLFPISKVCDEHGKILKRAEDRARKGQKLASWDVAKLEAIDRYIAGELTEAQALEVVRSENYRRAAWTDRNKGGRR